MIRRAVQVLLFPDAPSGGGTSAPAAPALTPPGSDPSGGDEGGGGDKGGGGEGEPKGAEGGDPPAGEDDSSDDDLASAFDNLDDRATKKPDDGEEGDPPSGDKPQETDEITPDNPKLPANFRKRLGEVNTELQAIKKERDELKSKIEAGATKETPEAFTKKIQELEKERDGLKGEIGMLKFEKSPEYLKQYETPFNEAAEAAKDAIVGLEVVDIDGDGMESARPAKWDDFTELYSMIKSDPVKGKMAAYRKADEIFKGASQEVKAHLAEVIRTENRASKALDAEKNQWKDRQAKRLADEEVRAAKLNDTWKTLDAQVKTKKPEWYSEVEGDKEGNALLQEGYAVVNKYLSARKDLPLEDVMILEAHIANRAAALPRMAHKVTQLEAQIAKMEKIIKKYEDSGPGGGRRDGGEGGGGGDDSFINDEDLGKAFS